MQNSKILIRLLDVPKLDYFDAQQNVSFIKIGLYIFIFFIFWYPSRIIIWKKKTSVDSYFELYQIPILFHN